MEQSQTYLDNSLLKEKVKDFSELLSTIQNLDSKKKQLWKEIYENAITDRDYAESMFMTLVGITQDKSTEHAVHGKSMSSYIERMSKANDQLIKLAELIDKYQPKDEDSDDDIFNRIKQ